MGLDMFLTKKHRIYQEDRKDTKISNPKLEINTARINEISEDVGYWRKANHIHKWFIDNCNDGDDDNGNDIYVAREKLEELLATCQKVLKASKLVKGKIKNGQTGSPTGWVDNMVDGKYIENSEVAQELLPTQSGFFFGNTDYNEYYIADVKETIKIIKAVLSEESGDIYYSASW